MRIKSALYLLIGLLISLPAFPAVIVQVNGANHTIPQTNERGWGTAVTAWIQAISSSTLQPNGGNFTLTNDVNFGSSFGIKASYLSSRNPNPSTAGILRLSVGDSVGWRNNANGGNLLLGVNASDLLTFGSVEVPTISSASTLTNKTIDADSNSISNIDNSDIKSGAAIALDKLSAVTASRALASDASGFISPSSVTSTELGYVSGVSSPVQTQLDAKQDSSSAVTLTGTQTLTNKTLTAPAINSPTGIVKGDVGLGNVDNTSDATKNSASATLTNKTINGAANTLSNIAFSSMTGTLSAASGGTGQSSFTKGDLLVTPGSTTLSKLGIGADGEVLTADTASTNGLKWAASAGAPTSSTDIQNLGIATSVGSSALTISLVQSNGSTPSTGASAVKVGFRNATLATGQYSQVSITSALSLVISSGSTLGHTSGVSDFIYVYLINNAGTAEIAVSSGYFGDDGTLFSTTAEGGAGAADSRGVIYSATARSNVALRVVGRIAISEATAGTWATNSTGIALQPFQPGKIAAAYWASASTAGSTSAPWNFDSREFDTHGAVTTGAGWRFTAPADRIYDVAVYGNPSGSVTFRAYIYKNNTIYKPFTNEISGGVVSGSTKIRLLKNEYIDIRPQSAITLNGNASLSASGANISIMESGLL